MFLHSVAIGNNDINDSKNDTKMKKNIKWILKPID